MATEHRLNEKCGYSPRKNKRINPRHCVAYIPRKISLIKAFILGIFLEKVFGMCDYSHHIITYKLTLLPTNNTEISEKFNNKNDESNI